MKNFFILSFLFMVVCAGTASAKSSVVDTPQKLTQEDFLVKVANYKANSDQWVYLGEKPCIIDFYADWCGPCRKIAPILKELAKEYKGEIVIYKVNVDKEKELASDFGITSIPTLLFCPMEGEPQLSKGALPREALVEAIESVLLKR